MDSFTDQQIINEMLKRFIVPQWYTREHIEDKCKGFTEDQVEHIVETVKYRVYQDVDQIIEEYIENYKEEQEEDDDDEAVYTYYKCEHCGFATGKDDPDCSKCKKEMCMLCIQV